MRLDTIEVTGFKSIRGLKLKLRRLNEMLTPPIDSRICLSTTARRHETLCNSIALASEGEIMQGPR